MAGFGNLKRRAGFTLVEVMIATLVAGITFGGVLTSVLFATRLNYASSQHYAAFTLCKERIEELRETDYENLTDGFTKKSSRRYQLDEENIPLMIQGPSGGTTITGTRRTDVYDYRTISRYENEPHYYVRVRFTWRSRTQGNLAENPERVTELYSRIYPL